MRNACLKKLDRARLLMDVSLWSASLARIAESIDRTQDYVDVYHIDVGDAHFVPSLLFFPDMVQAIRKETSKPLHVHLMLDNPLSQVDDFVSAGADIITIHAENGEKIPAVISRLQEKNVAIGLAFQLDTELELLDRYLDRIDLVLLMGTQLGIKGVGLDPRSYERLRDVKEKIAHRGLQEEVIVSSDGGIREETVPRLYEAGTDMITPGSLVFKSPNLAATARWVHSLQR
jgi:ribulose-phosphate 3-epimerase